MKLDSIEVTYSLARSEVWNWYWESWWKGGVKWAHLQIFMAIFLVCLYFDFQSDTLSIFSFVKICVIFIATFILMVAWPQIMYKPQVRFLSASSEGIHTKIAKYDTTIVWRDIERITLENGFIRILGKSKNAMLIPERAFKGNQIMNEFYELCLSAHSGAEDA